MIIVLIILLLIWCFPIVLYIAWKRGDWYLFLFPIILSLVSCVMLAVISYELIEACRIQTIQDSSGRHMIHWMHWECSGTE